jgi:hypothetical protein
MIVADPESFRAVPYRRWVREIDRIGSVRIRPPGDDETPFVKAMTKVKRLKC